MFSAERHTFVLKIASCVLYMQAILFSSSDVKFYVQVSKQPVLSFVPTLFKKISKKLTPAHVSGNHGLLRSGTELQ